MMVMHLPLCGPTGANFALTSCINITENDFLPQTPRECPVIYSVSNSLPYFSHSILTVSSTWKMIL